MDVLIYADKDKLKPVGGPHGYLYNLKSGLDKIDDHCIHFLNEKSGNAIKNNENKNISSFKKKLWLPYFLFSTVYGLGNGIREDISKYDAIHFHSVVDLYNCRKQLENYHGKIILTSHSPKAFHLEVADMIDTAHFPFKKKWVDKFEKINQYAFEKCTNIIFPCKEAMEPYIHTWKYFVHNEDKIIKKSKFVLTGLSRPEKIQSFDFSFIKNRNCKFVVCFVGRHNEVKGYDLIQKAAKIVQAKDPDIYFVAAGKEEPLSHDQSLNNWYEIGWTNNPLGVTQASDLFVLPNRETYFDLALIEAISVPANILITNTGGNKYYKRYNSSGINFCEPDAESLAELIIWVKNNRDLETGKKENKIIYKNYFTPEMFAANYLKTVSEIIDGI